MLALHALGCLAGAFDADGSSLVQGLPDLEQTTLDMIAEKSLVAAGEVEITVDGFMQLQVGRIWLLKPGATLDLVPAAERMAARAVLQCGQAVLLLSPDVETEKAIRVPLLALAEADEGGGVLVGHA